MSDQPLWMTPAQAAPLLGMSAKTVRDLCAAGEITCDWNGRTGPGARYRLTVAQVNAHIHRRTKFARNRVA